MSGAWQFDWTALHTWTPRLTATPGTGGVLRQVPADFLVEELPAYRPTGQGEHLYLWIQKEGQTTAQVVRALCTQLGLREQQIGVAGLKDRHAITQQWLSVPARAERSLSSFDAPGVQILEVNRHGNKLGMGHLRGNRFTVRVREAAGQGPQAQTLLELLRERGVPNYFGPQRFGLSGLNAEEGLRVLRGQSQLSDPRLKRFLVSSVQSLLFNHFVSLRLERGVFDQVLRGDMAKKHQTGGVFLVEDPQTDSARARAGELSATGTLFGRKTGLLSGPAGALEGEVLRSFGLSASDFSSRRGDRRLVRVFPTETDVTAHEDGYTIRFCLPRGSFATSVLREVMHTPLERYADSEDAAAEDLI